MTYPEVIKFTDSERKEAFRTLEESRRKRQQRRDRLNRKREQVLCSGYEFNRFVLTKLAVIHEQVIDEIRSRL